MNDRPNRRRIRSLFLLIPVLFTTTLYYCKTAQKGPSGQTAGKDGEGYKRPDIPWMKDFLKSPVVAAGQSLKEFTLEEGFEISLVASEPMVQTPVAMLFDARGRMWIAEMTGYMPDVSGTGEDRPNGRIVILEDTDSDGRPDRRKIFLDSLVLPRSLCFVDNGLLVAEPPNLWFYPIENDRPGKRTLVDSVYAVGGNVEHQPNGLLRTVDNWIYNAKSAKRYRRYGDGWKIENTHFRGQWGISQDNQGRLYYNHNSANVLGDNFLPGFGHWNANQKRLAGYNNPIVANNRVYPIRPTPGVNRGYMPGILDDSLRLVNFTAACGPLVYRGDLFDPAYRTSVFVPEPSANLIKRNIIDEQGFRTPGRQAYTGREFLASTDERFRPVALCDAPDGAMYVLDMARGIIQHKTYVTPYLRGEIQERSLTNPLNNGRIYKITPKGAVSRPLAVNADTDAELVALLGHANGWIRDHAQQTLVDQKRLGSVPALKKVAASSKNEIEIIHCLWTLEGLGKISTEEVLPLYDSRSYRMRAMAFGLTASVLDKNNFRTFEKIWSKLLAENQTDVFPYLAFSMHALSGYDPVFAADMLKKLAEKQPDDAFTAGAVISNLEGKEEKFLQALQVSDTASIIVRQLNAAIQNGISRAASQSKAMLASQYPLGAEFYNTICQTCHGADGNGIPSLAPPLNQSEWVNGRKDILTGIVLFGLTGPVTVNKRLYQAPEISGDMPGIGYDPAISNEQIAQMLSYIRKSWQNNAEPVSAGEVEALRKKFSGREKAFTTSELEQAF
ncbi:DUF7133 domain-containing protein [Ravibacter arvi]